MAKRHSDGSKLGWSKISPEARRARMARVSAARNAALSPRRRRAIARAAASARWAKAKTR